MASSSTWIPLAGAGPAPPRSSTTIAAIGSGLAHSTGTAVTRSRQGNAERLYHRRPMANARSAREEVCAVGTRSGILRSVQRYNRAVAANRPGKARPPPQKLVRAIRDNRIDSSDAHFRQLGDKMGVMRSILHLAKPGEHHHQSRPVRPKRGPATTGWRPLAPPPTHVGHLRTFHITDHDGAWRQSSQNAPRHLRPADAAPQQARRGQAEVSRLKRRTGGSHLECWSKTWN